MIGINKIKRREQMGEKKERMIERMNGYRNK